MIVVKVSGSLFDLPDLGTRLRTFLSTLHVADPVSPTRERGFAFPSLARRANLLVPGGGATADVVRAWDRDHCLGPVGSHWLALRACTLNAWLLRELLPEAEVVSDPVSPTRERGFAFPSLARRANTLTTDLRNEHLTILDAHAFALADEGNPGSLPHAWQATSDSVAARAAELFSAELILLKSVTINPGKEATDWEQAAHHGHVDPLFPSIVARSDLRVRAINLRTYSGG